MSRTWLIALALAAASIGGAVLIDREPSPPAALAAKPRLALLTSLPLLFGEAFALEAPANAAVERMARTYDLVPIAVADRRSLQGHRQLLMAHPRAQPAEVLVDLDAWVRDGGRVVVLADPALAWESRRQLGDPLRPPPDFADTGLLAHWGVRLGIDAAGDGTLRVTGANCAAFADGLGATCQVGRGTARIIADADFIMGEGPEAARRLDLMMAQLGARDSR
jgi:hypothetical protein